MHRPGTSSEQCAQVSSIQIPGLLDVRQTVPPRKTPRLWGGLRVGAGRLKCKIQLEWHPKPRGIPEMLYGALWRGSMMRPTFGQATLRLARPFSKSIFFREAISGIVSRTKKQGGHSVGWATSLCASVADERADALPVQSSIPPAKPTKKRGNSTCPEARR